MSDRIFTLIRAILTGLLLWYIGDAFDFPSEANTIIILVSVYGVYIAGQVDSLNEKVDRLTRRFL